MALICNPELIIADEPTTALDVTIQAQILDLLREIKNKINGSIMLITHDLGVIAEMADYVVVMYAGKVIERGTALEIFQNPLHPYTMGLQKSKPAVNKKVERLYNIPGQVPNPVNMPSYCYFKDRCDKCIGKCNGEYPPMIQVTPTHSVSCYLYNENKRRVSKIWKKRKIKPSTTLLRMKKMLRSPPKAALPPTTWCLTDEEKGKLLVVRNLKKYFPLKTDFFGDLCLTYALSTTFRSPLKPAKR